MKKLLLTLVLLVGMVFGLFAQKLTYQAVIRDNSQQLVTNTVVKATVTITFTSGNPYQAEVNGSTNIHGLLSIEFGDESLASRDWTNATIAVKVVNSATPSIVYVNEVPRPVSAVPYALSVNGQSIQNYLTEHHYVNLDKLNDTLGAYSTTAAMDGRHYLTSDSAVIKTMQGNITTNANSIANLTLHTAKAAIRDSVEGQIHDSIVNIAAKSHIHGNKDLLDTYTQTEANLAEAVAKMHAHSNAAVLAATEAPYTDADSAKLHDIAAGAEVNVQADWKQADNSKDDFIKNKPSITDTVNNILTTGKYVTETTLDSRHYLRSDSTVITTMQNDIVDLKAGQLDCDKVKDCIKDTLSKYTPTADLTGLLQQLTTRLDAQDAKMDSLAKLISSQDSTINSLNNQVEDLQPFECGKSKVKDVDNNKYPTVKIGNQCWMKENLRTKLGTDGDKGYPTGAGADSLLYGRLYTWTAMMKGASSTNYPVSGDKVQGICPTGWHVPSDAEWDTLTTYVNIEANGYRCDGGGGIANALSSITGWTTPNACCAGHDSTTLNKTGFSAVPAGYFNASFKDFGDESDFWSATESEDSKALYRYLSSFLSTVNWNATDKGRGLSVRCLRDAETGGGTTPSAPATMSCEQMMECMGDTLGKLNAKIENLQNTVSTQDNTINEQNSRIDDLNTAVTEQGQKMDSLAHLVDSLAKLPHGCGETTIVDTVTCYPNLGANESVTKTVTRGQNIDLSKAFTHPVETNWEIAGWNTKADGTGTSYTNTLTTTGNLTLYAQWRTFCTGTPFSANEVGSGRIDSLKDVENNKYAVVQIGNQCWMKENLRTKTLTYGQVWTKTDADSAIYGRYYDWQAAMQIEAGNTTSYTAGDKHRGICPAGWHVPSDAEWTVLTDYVKGKSEYICGEDANNIANALADTTGWSSNTSSGCNAGNTGGKANLTGFSAVPAGLCFDGDFDYFGGYAYFWSATQGDGDDAWYRCLASFSSVGSNYFYKDYGFSVRCLRDAGVGGGDTPDTPSGGETTIVDTVTCYPNLGANESVKNTVTRDENFNLSTVSFSHPVETNNWEIASWNTKADGTGTSYATNATFTTTGNLTLYAQWRTFCTGTPSSANEVGSGRIDSLKDVENNKYAVVQIGNQCWMKENLRTSTNIADTGNIYTPTTEQVHGYDVAIYGRMYDWAAVMQGASSSTTAPSGVQGICPEGWHVPSDAEWDTLTNYVNSVADYKCGGITDNIANALSSPTGWQVPSECAAGHNSTTLNKTGFSVVPAGYFFGGSFGGFGGFGGFGNYAYFWSATRDGDNDAWYRDLDSYFSYVGRRNDDKALGFFVRCLRD